MHGYIPVGKTYSEEEIVYESGDLEEAAEPLSTPVPTRGLEEFEYVMVGTDKRLRQVLIEEQQRVLS